MDINQLSWLDWQIIIWIPLAFVTFNETKKNWHQIFDADLSVQDRASLQKINIFFITPIVVLCHEIGHAIATLWANGKIAEFHFGVFWGYVVPSGSFTQEQILIIYLAGSAVQVIIGMTMLVASVFVRAPAIVALLVYSGLSAVAGTIIIYTLLSMVGAYGDWIAIYQSPLTSWTIPIGIAHAAFAVFLFYLMYGSKPKLWFSCKTRPKWCKDYKAAMERIAKDPSAVNYLSLAWTYYLVGLTKETEHALKIVKEKDPNLLERYILEGWLKQDRGQTQDAVELFEQIADAPTATQNQKCRALMAIGHSLLAQAEAGIQAGRGSRNAGGASGSRGGDGHGGDSVSRGGGGSASDGAGSRGGGGSRGGSGSSGGAGPVYEDFAGVLASYDQAHEADPSAADPLYYKATVLNKLGLHKEAEEVLKGLQGRKWLDPALSELHLIEMQVARKSDKGEQ